MGVSWTLVYEMYFYLLFALALLLRRSVPASAAITAAMVGILVASNRAPSGVLTDFLANPIVLEFLMGMWLGVFHLTYRRGQSSTYKKQDTGDDWSWIDIAVVDDCANGFHRRAAGVATGFRVGSAGCSHAHIFYWYGSAIDASVDLLCQDRGFVLFVVSDASVRDDILRFLH
ncbi:hypothetical protein ACFSKM_20195 [Ancylobacter dichloromethanicus]